MTRNKHIAVIGAGWLGKKYVDVVREAPGIHCQYSNRIKVDTDDFSHAFSFGSPIPLPLVEAAECVFITATLPKESAAFVLPFVEQLHAAVPSDCVVVFTSTIGVYREKSGVVHENSENVHSESVYLILEKALEQRFKSRAIVLRLGGLIGEDRHPITSLSKRQNCADGQQGVNLVHRADILSFFELILQGKVGGGIYNLVFPEHPMKSLYYTQQAINRNLPIPTFETGEESGKIVSSDKSQSIEGFSYQFHI